MSSYADIDKGSSIALDRLPLNRELRSAPPAIKFADAGPLGLFSFALTTFILSLYNIGARGITAPNVVVGMAVASGGLAQFMAGMWEFPRGNTFAATAFSSYGAFWISYSLILLPGTGIVAAYKDNTEELESALGIYLMGWFLITFIFFVVTLRKNVAFICLFFCLFTTFLLLGAGALSGLAALHKIGGIVGLVTAFIAFYTGLSMLLAAETSPIMKLPLGNIV
ncbi:hypothetical protein APHAL10511_000647 [Amanita phalloides]|nr:hypothetical protein APHAL10511_000647 [Amanita phalloides]